MSYLVQGFTTFLQVGKVVIGLSDDASYSRYMTRNVRSSIHSALFQESQVGCGLLALKVKCLVPVANWLADLLLKGCKGSFQVN